LQHKRYISLVNWSQSQFPCFSTDKDWPATLYTCPSLKHITKKWFAIISYFPSFLYLIYI
jgi:hypothetical protein